MSTITGQLQLQLLAPSYLSRSCCRDSPGTRSDSQPIWFHEAITWDRNANFCTKANSRFFPVIRTPVHMCFLDAKKAFDRVNNWTLAKKLLDRNVHCILWNCLYFGIESNSLWYDRWGNSLSIIFRCSNGIRQGRQLLPLLYNVYTDDLDHHLQLRNRCRVPG